MHCGASGFSIGAVLSQMVDGEQRPIAYCSRTLNITERRLSTFDRELLAIYFAVTVRFKQYLFARFFYFFTDHRPLLGIFASKLENDSDRVCRQKLKLLSNYDFKIIFMKGSLLLNADALSRIDISDVRILSKLLVPQ